MRVRQDVPAGGVADQNRNPAVDALEVVVDRLGPFEGCQPADPVVVRDGLDVCGGADEPHVIGVLAHGAMKRDELAEREAQPGLAMLLGGHVDRASLAADVTGPQVPQPPCLKGIAARRCRHELLQQVVMQVDDRTHRQPGAHASSDPRIVAVTRSG